MKRTYFDYFGGGSEGSPEGQGEAASHAPKAEESDANLRVSQRIAIGMRIKVQNQEGLEESAMTLNVSNRGLSFVSTKPFKVKEEVMVELYLGHHQKVGPLPGRIVWAIPHADTWRHGVSWSKKVDMGLATKALSADPK